MLLCFLKYFPATSVLYSGSLFKKVINNLFKENIYFKTIIYDNKRRFLSLYACMFVLMACKIYETYEAENFLRIVAGVFCCTWDSRFYFFSITRDMIKNDNELSFKTHHFHCELRKSLAHAQKRFYASGGSEEPTFRF